MRSQWLLSWWQWICTRVLALLGLGSPLPPLADVATVYNAHSVSITRILGCNPGPFTLQGTNCYLVSLGGSDAWLIDTGAGHRRFASLLQRHLTLHNLTLRAVFITHRHQDHVGGVAALLGSPQGASITAVHKYLVDGEPDTIPGVHCFRYSALHDNQEVALGMHGVLLRTMHTPGHSNDHCCFMLHNSTHRDPPVLFSGDNVLGSGTSVMEDLASYMKSLGRMHTVLIDVVEDQPVLLCPGHGDVVSDGAVKVAQYIEHRQAREGQVRAALQATESTAAKLVPLVYPALPRALLGAAAWNVFQHLEKLAAEGEVRCLDAGALAYFREQREKGALPVESRSWAALHTKKGFVYGVRFAA